MSGSSLIETNPTMQINEALIVEKDQEIERLRQENERLRMENSNKNQQELTQKVAKLEEELAESKNKHFDLINCLISLDVKQLNEKDKLSQQNLFSCAHNAVRTENKVDKESEGQQNTSVLILGGNGYLDRIYLLDSKAQSWKKLSITLPVGLEDFGAVVLNEEIYIFGGSQCMNANYTCYQHCYKLKDDGSWMKLASLNQSRFNISSSSLVYKGDIWVIGGSSEDSDEALKSVEKYDISQDKWTYMPEMNYARSSAAAAVFKDRIFVTGGEDEKDLKSVEIFDPKLQKWILFCDLPCELYSHTMLISDSILFIFGGSADSYISECVWEMDIEDPEKKWTEKQSFNHPRKHFGIAKLSNGIIAFGGSIPHGKTYTSEIFDGKKWIVKPRLPQSLSNFGYTSISRSLEESFLNKFSSPEQQDTSVLILGGWSSPNSIYLLDSNAQSWKKLRINLPVEMHGFGAVVFNEDIYICGGSSKDQQREYANTYTYHLHCYKLKDDGNWMQLASLNQKRAFISSSSLVYKGDIWAIGGYSGGHLNSVEKYDIFQDKWTYMPAMNYPRRDAAAAVFKDRIFVTGGYRYVVILKSVEMFDPKLQKWILFCDLPFEVTGHAMLINNSTLSIFGGYSESGLLDSVWEMDIEDPEKKWTEKQSFNHPRKHFGIGKLSDGIIAFGGWSEIGEISEIFYKNEWIYGPILPQKLSYFAYTSIPQFLEEVFIENFS